MNNYQFSWSVPYQYTVTVNGITVNNPVSYRDVVLSDSVETRLTLSEYPDVLRVLEQFSRL